MSRRLRWFIGIVAVVFFILFVRIYVSMPIRARVVDASTGRPLEGVVVVADWQLMGGLEGTVGEGHIATFESVTAADGAFDIPWWGPRVRISILGGLGWAPDLKLFRPGYGPTTLTNRRYSKSPIRRSDWNGKEVRLEPWAEDLLSYDKHLAGLQERFLHDLAGWPGRPSCHWRKIPRLLRAIEAERIRLLQSGVPSTIRPPEEVDRRFADSVAKCGSIAAMVRAQS
jgi:hypothetical protein